MPSEYNDKLRLLRTSNITFIQWVVYDKVWNVQFQSWIWKWMAADRNSGVFFQNLVPCEADKILSFDVESTATFLVVGSSDGAL